MGGHALPRASQKRGYTIRVHSCPFVSIRVHSCPFVSIRVHSCPFVSIRVHSCPFVSIRVHSCPFVSIRVHSSHSWLSPWTPRLWRGLALLGRTFLLAPHPCLSAL